MWIFVRTEWSGMRTQATTTTKKIKWNSCSSSASQRQFKRVQINRQPEKKNVEAVKTSIAVRVAERNANEMPNIRDELRMNYDNSNKYCFVSSVAAVSLLCIVICCFINNFNCAQIVWTAHSTSPSQRRLVHQLYRAYYYYYYLFEHKNCCFADVCVQFRYICTEWNSLKAIIPPAPSRTRHTDTHARARSLVHKTRQ